MEAATVILLLLVAGLLLSTIFRRLEISDTVSYIIGGILVSAILSRFNVDIASSLTYGEPLRWIGLTIFSFYLGYSVGLKRIAENLRIAVASELIMYVVFWASANLLAWLMGFGYVERVLLFLMCINSSSVAVVALSKLYNKISQSIYARAVIQTSVEDLLQFTLFTLLFAVGVSITETPLGPFVRVVIVAGLAAIFFFTSKLMLGFLSKTKFIDDKENKFLVAVGFAILFASLATATGLPPLFGAFIAGVSFSALLNLDDIADMINGLRSLGLLLYFTSLGSQLYLDLCSRDSLTMALQGVALGLALHVVRALALFTATLFTGCKASDGLVMTMYLAPLSEMGIIFTYALVERGVISESVAATFTVAVITSMILFGAMTPSMAARAYLLERIMPSRVTGFLRSFAAAYTKIIDVATVILSPMIMLSATTLALAYANSLVVRIVDKFNLSMSIALTSVIISSVGITISFVKAARTMFNNVLQNIKVLTKGHRRAMERALNLLMGSLALTLQALILLELFEAFPTVLSREPLYTLVTLLIWLGVVFVVIFELARHYAKSS